MIIGVDIRHLLASQEGGIAQYTVCLLDKLIEKFPASTFKLFYSGRKISAIAKRWEEKNNVVIRHLKLPNRFLDPAFKFLSYPKIDQLIGGLDVFLSPHFLLTPLSVACPRVLVIHDLSFERFPGFFSHRDLLWQNFMHPKSQAQHADAIISVSGSTRRDLMAIWGIDGGKIKVVYPGIGFISDGRKNNIQEHEKIIKKYSLPENFILALSVIEPRKNYNGLIMAFELFDEISFPKNKNISLVIAGPKPKSAREVVLAVGRSKLRDRIFLPGFIDEADKACLYAAARIFVYPSFFEGFGFPPLEAMALGTPTVVSNRSSLPEIVGDAAIAIDPHNISEMARIMAELFADDNVRNILSEKGKIKALEYEWGRTAEQIYGILEGVVNKKQGYVY